MNFNALKEIALKMDIEALELYKVKKSNLSFTYFDDKIESRKASNEEVYSLRCYYNNRLANIYLENLGEDTLEKALEKLKAGSKYLKEEPNLMFQEKANYALVENKFNKEKISLEAKQNLVLKIINYLKNKTNLYDHARITYLETKQEVTINNSFDLNVINSGEYAYITIGLYLKEDTNIKNGFDVIFIKDLTNVNYEEVLDNLIKETTAKFKATSLKSGSYKTILSNKVVGDLLNAFSSLFYASSIKNKLSFLEGKVGEKIFNENITIYDDACYKDALIKLPFDDEGVPTKKTTIVKNGVLETYLYDLATAHYFKTKTTGNGYKAKVSSKVDVNAANIVLEAGNSSLEDLLNEVNEGVYITSITGLHAGINKVSGNLNVQCGGYYVKNGKLDHALTLIVLSGNFKDILNDVLLVGNDTYYDGSVASPSLYIKKMNISGV